MAPCSISSVPGPQAISGTGTATLTAFTVEAVAAALPQLPELPARWLVTGGGRLNATLMALLAARLEVPVEPVDDLGWSGDALEAQAFGYLAVRSVRGLPLSLPTTTGCPRPISGGRFHGLANRGGKPDKSDR